MLILRRLPRALITQWGFALFVVETALTALRVFRRPMDFNFHYHVFQIASPYLWRGQDPYGIDAFPGTATFYPYSPTSAMFFFHLFSPFPELLGEILFVLVSLAVLGYGISVAIQALRETIGVDLWTAPERHLVWLMLGAELMGALLYTKIEIFCLGVALIGMSYVMNPATKKQAWGFILLGFISAWKFQFLPCIAFAILCYPKIRSMLWAGAIFSASFVATMALPLVRFSLADGLAVTRHWMAAIGGLVEATYMKTGYAHLYQILAQFGLLVAMPTVKLITTVATVILAVFTFIWSRKQMRPLGVLLAFGLGIMLQLFFSPFSQHNAYVLYFPALLACAALHSGNTGLLISFLLISLSGSDLNPKPLRYWSIDHYVCVYGVLVLFITLLCSAVRKSQPNT